MKRKKKIGLALGSGASRGWAHIGVIRTLESWGIYPDVIAGCSIGSLVGGAVASGKLQELEVWASSLTGTQVNRFFDLNFERSGGPIKGQRLIQILKKLGFECSIEEMPIPFCAIATDLRSGKEVQITKGSFMSALRASGSIPGFLTPVQLDGRWLVDGGVVSPLPVTACRELGADLVIAVNLNAGVLEASDWKSTNRYASLLTSIYEKSKSFIPESYATLVDSLFDAKPASKGDRNPRYFEVIYSMTSIMQEQILKLQLQLDPPEIQLNPNLSHLHLFDFDKAGEAIHEGVRCTLQQKKNILETLKKHECL